MVVSEYDCTRPQLESALDYFAGIDRRMVDGAALVQFIGDQVVAFVQALASKVRRMATWPPPGLGFGFNIPLLPANRRLAAQRARL